MSPAIDVRNAFRIFSSAGGATAALQGLDLTVERGELVVALGPSGSGKTTLLRVVGGLERLSAGSVRVFDVDLDRLRSKSLATFRAANVGFLEQHYSRALSPGLSCRETVALQLELLGWEPRASRAVADELLERVELADRRNEEPLTLSGGEQQRVALCAAIAHRPTLLLADEPVGELDAASAETVYAAIAELVREAGTTALVVSHDPGAGAISDRVVSVTSGRVVEESVPGEPAALVVSRGWVHLPEKLLRELSEPDRLTVEARHDTMALRAVRGRPPTAEDVERLEAVDSGKRDPATRPVAELREVAKRYRVGDVERVVLEGFSHVVRAGRLVAVVGRSGTGKTTLLHLLAGLERASSGDVLLLGESLGDRTRSELARLRARHVALVAQEPGLVPYLTARENVALTRRLRGLPESAGDVASVLEAVGLDPRLGHGASTLSAGERQRAAVARAFVTDAELLLVDEPTARLDRDAGRVVGELLVRCARAGRAVVCATHDPDLVELADEVIELQRPTRPVRAEERTLLEVGESG